MAGKEETGNIWESEAGQMAGVVFAYITHYIFMNTKELHKYYKNTDGRRLKRVHLFGKGIDTGSIETSTVSLFEFSRQRYARMRSFSLGNFHISKNEKEKWEEKFNIDMDYFYMGDGKTVLGCDYEDWKSHFENQYVDDKIEQKLKDMLANMNEYIGTPIYNIYYFIKHNEKFNARNSLQTALLFLEKAPIREWEDVEEKDRIRYMKVLKKHYEYIRMKTGIQRIESED